MAAVEPAVSGAVAADAGLPARIWTFITTWPGSNTTLSMIAVSLLIAVAYLSTRGGRSWRRARPWKVFKLLFSWRYLWHRSHLFDILMMIFNTRVVGLTIGWFLISGTFVSKWTYSALVAHFGAQPPSTWPFWLVMVVGSIAVFLAYEFGYWLDHYLSHVVPFLWEFHKVHHQAEVLSPATNFRVHPIDTLVFTNILSLVMGPVNGLTCYLFGLPYEQVSMFGYFTILTAFAYLVVQLQHTHVWIPFTGIWGKLFVSPAHHQIHHSSNPIHFDKNMGSCIAVFDWMFGTLHLPTRQREKLTFGTESSADPHTVMEGLINPYLRGFGHVRRWAGVLGGLGRGPGGSARPPAEIPPSALGPSPLRPAEPHPV